MFNPIEEKKRLVQSRINKSFEGDIEKAYQVGDTKDFKGRTYYVHALNSSGKPLWRLKKDGGKKDDDGGKGKSAAEPQEKSVAEHAKKASDEALKRAMEDENASDEVREAAKKELESRGKKTDEHDNDDKGGSEKKTEEQPEKKEGESDSYFTEDDAKRIDELEEFERNIRKLDLDEQIKLWRTDEWQNNSRELESLKQKRINAPLKIGGYLNLDDFKDIRGIGTIHVTKPVDNNGNEIQNPYIKITFDKKSDVKKFIKDVNSKLGIDLSEDNFDFSPRNRYSGSYYEIGVNPETKEFGDVDKIRRQIKDAHIESKRKIAEEERKRQKKATMNSLKAANSITKESVEKLFEDDETKSNALAFFNYGDDSECSEEEKENFEKLKKLGARVSEYFDWKEDEEADAYERKMQAKGYRLFDISTSDGYLWLLVKNNKLSKPKKNDDVEKADLDENIEKARVGTYSDNAQNRRLMRVGQKYGETKNTFKPGHKVKATLPTGKVMEAVYVEPYGTDSHTVKVDGKLYGVKTANLEKIGGQYSGRKPTLRQREAAWDKLDELKDKYFDLKRQRKSVEVDMEEELAELGEEAFNDGNNPTVVRYAKELEKLDQEIAKTKEKYQKQKQKLYAQDA